jgi:2-(1,2-epoxy-1,2-dihydrophenyl)acetyl-CoA isomerase
MDYETIILKKEEGVATIILNRPDRRNAITSTMSAELLKATEELGWDDAVKVVVITGAGPAFCAGGDLESLLGATPLEIAEVIRKGGTRIILNLRKMLKPVIVSVNGAAVGAGCNLALAGDIIIASENARFGEVFVNIGAHPDWGGTYFLPRLVGVTKACELFFTGKTLDAKEAERIGLVNEVVPADLLETRTRELALSLARGPSVAIGLIKNSIYQGLETDLASALENEAKAQALCFLTDDLKEGLKSFSEKRPPVFTGK